MSDRTITIKLKGDTKDAEASARRLSSVYSSEFKKIQSEFKNFGGSTQTKEIRAKFNDGDLKKAQTEIKRIQSENLRAEKSLTTQIEREAKQQATAKVREMRRASSELIKEIDRVKREESKRTNITPQSSSIGKISVISGFVGGAAAGAISTVTSALTEGGAALLNYSAKMEQTKISFGVLLKNTEKAEILLKDLSKFAAETPFEMPGITDAAKSLLAFGVAQQNIVPTLRSIGDIASGTGVPLTELAEIYGKAKVQGRLFAEDVNQLTGRGIPIIQEFAKQFGVSETEVKKLVESGKVGFPQLEKAFQDMTATGGQFSGMMEAQSKSFFGAFSTIKDTIVTVSATAFAPFFDKISKLAVEASQKVQAQGNDFNAVGTIIGGYIAQGIGLALQTGLDALAGYIGNRLNNIFSKGEIFDPLFVSIGKGFLKPFGFFKEELSKTTQAFSGDLTKAVDMGDVKFKLDPITNTFQRIKEEVKSTPSLAEQLEADKAKKESETLAGIIKDLALQVRFFGDESQVAATKQNLIRQGITDFTSAQAKSALAYAGTLDNLKKIRDLQEKDKEDAKRRAEEEKKIAEDYKKNLENISEQLKKTREDARFELEFANPTKIQEFDRYVKENVGSFRELKGEIEATRRELILLQESKSVKGRDAAQADFIKNIQDQINQLNAIDTDAFKAKVKDLGASMNLRGVLTGTNPDNQRDVSLQHFADTVQSYITNIKLLESTGVDTDKVRESFGRFLETFKSDKTNQLGQYLQVFSGDQTAKVIENLIALSKAQDTFTDSSNREIAVGEYKQILEDLNGNSI